MSTSRSLVRIEPALYAPAVEAGAITALKLATRPPRRVGMGLISVFLGGFFVWGLTVPIAGGAVAPGVISPDGNRRTVQHLEGGIIARLDVRDGDRVVAGQRLVILESIQARTIFNALQHQHNTLVVTQARLQAEQDGRVTMEIPPGVEAALGDPDLRRIVAAQQSMLATRRAGSP
jgi:HlyD family secretion protein